MIELTHSVTGHKVRTGSESVEFWTRAGYREQPKAPAKKAASKKTSTTKK